MSRNRPWAGFARLDTMRGRSMGPAPPLDRPLDGDGDAAGRAIPSILRGQRFAVTVGDVAPPSETQPSLSWLSRFTKT